MLFTLANWNTLASTSSGIRRTVNIEPNIFCRKIMGLRRLLLIWLLHAQHWWLRKAVEKSSLAQFCAYKKFTYLEQFNSWGHDNPIFSRGSKQSSLIFSQRPLHACIGLLTCSEHIGTKTEHTKRRTYLEHCSSINGS